MLTKMERLQHLFKEAKFNNVPLVSLEVRMEGFPKNEIITNPIENFEAKAAYYAKVYDENLDHKFSPGISIVKAWYGDDTVKREWKLDLIELG